MILGGAAFTVLLALASLRYDDVSSLRLAQISLLYPAAYGALSLWLGGLHRTSGSR